MDPLAAWIILERVDLVTGYFGGADELPLLSADARSPRTPLRELEHRSHTASSLKHAASLQELARRSHAVTSTPMYRPFYVPEHEPPYEVMTHPSFWLLYGFYSSITVPATTPAIPAEDELSLGRDIWDETVSVQDMPKWQNNDEGSAACLHFGDIRMERPRWREWIKGCFETAIRLDTDGTEEAVLTGSRGRASEIYERSRGGFPKGPWERAPERSRCHRHM